MKIKDNFSIRVSDILISDKGISRIKQIISYDVEVFSDNFNIFAVCFDNWVVVAKPISIINPASPPKFNIMFDGEASIDNRKSHASILKHFKSTITSFDEDKFKYAIQLAKKIIRVLEGKYDK